MEKRLIATKKNINNIFRKSKTTGRNSTNQ